ncbi:hypothetical protein A2721_01630 [Candidatus Gottesmanbacteria bacterium RIFCSPHIGHO2_01_FULL_47_48]|uniref:CopG antitoxin of type II toxin-antitoxin system n=1 Tax=Candidatus Gottesmanbacteria bacterium RIFCSPHIGHO2_01_FULL_47_48 TaxID=1798381 RepID=A0A1F6A1B2_9BACT|nr:MAG: hypothetical protein A2721_01630 [Candidatus Gottesmanbacteria bacterium RIFCSPHIGHO2_01_FULL_47_48]
MKKNNRKIDPIPKFRNIAEEAEFWDTHSFSDYWDKWKPVKLKVAKNLSDGITVRFDGRTLEEIRSRAAKKGLGPTQLIRMWVMEQLGKKKALV